jgi:serine/threonine protein kinase/dipeptidyl aminopeptidase/acylaminoacyl peptidase
MLRQNLTQGRWTQIEELFHRAAECAPEHRTALLDEACGNDAELRREVETLLSYDKSAGDSVQAAVLGGLDNVGFPLTGETISHYSILEGLGGGGMGLVYRAEDIKLGRRVALKFLPEESVKDPAALGRFEREARSASALEHPNICPIYEFGEHEGQPFLVMQLLEGQTLRELIAAAGAGKPPLELHKLLDLAVQIVEGLDAAHQKGIIHRDIKPANIFVTRESQAKILDFGLAKLASILSVEVDNPDRNVGDEAGSERTSDKPLPISTLDLFLSRTGVAIGTAGYMSPEQVRGEKLDARTDLFSFGLVLYEMATGKRAFAGDTGPELQEAILTQMPSPAREVNPEVPVKLAKIVHRAIEKEREARYQSASEMRADLMSLQQEIEPRRRASQWVMATGVAVLLLTSAAFWFAKRQLPSSATLPHLNLRQLTSNSSENGPAAGAISPDGRHLAYADGVGMHLKLIQTGETQTIPQPDEVKSNWVSWQINAWFPDGTRFIASAYRHRGDTTYRNSQGTSVWIVSLSGGPPHKLRDEAVADSVSPDGSLIAFETNPGRLGDHEIWLMNPDGGQPRKLFDIDENGAIGGLQWSPDGQRVIYVKAEGSFDNFVFVSGDLNGGPRTTIRPPSDPKRISGLIWLPDGRMIYSMDEPGFMYACNLWQIRMDPRLTEFIGNPERVTNIAGFCAMPSNVTSDGKRLAFFEWRPNTNIYVADLQAGGTRISTPTRLTAEQSWNDPFGWTADSKTVFFDSNRRMDGMVLFKQPLDQDTAEPIIPISKDEDLGGECVSPEGSWIFYGVTSHDKAPGKLMRVPVTGGSPQLVLTGSIYGAPRCAKSPANFCAVAERSADRKQLVFTAFDPVNGREGKLAEWNTEATSDYYWDLSPDGTRIALLKNHEGRIQILWLNGRAPEEIKVEGWDTLSTATWTADGNGLFVSSYTERGAVLLSVDLQGNARLLWEHKGGIDTYGVPSPDGRHLAMRGWVVEGNMWMMENF